MTTVFKFLTVFLLSKNHDIIVPLVNSLEVQLRQRLTSSIIYLFGCTSQWGDTLLWLNHAILWGGVYVILMFTSHSHVCILYVEAFFIYWLPSVFFILVCPFSILGRSTYVSFSPCYLNHVLFFFVYNPNATAQGALWLHMVCILWCGAQVLQCCWLYEFCRATWLPHHSGREGVDYSRLEIGQTVLH